MLAKKQEEHRKQTDTIKNYTTTTGYKNIIRDSFHSISFAGGLSLLAFSVQAFLVSFNAPELLQIFISQFTASIYT